LILPVLKVKRTAVALTLGLILIFPDMSPAAEAPETEAATLPSRFSWAERGKKPTVRSQGALGTCWALTAAEALESALLPEQHLIFSADHLSLNNGFQITQEQGGDYSMIMSYFADGKGPVLEEEDPYGDGISPDGLARSATASDMVLLEGMSREQIQKTIYGYGSVQSSLCMDRERTDNPKRGFYNPETFGYYDPVTEELNHDILILGWDDDYLKENFKIAPMSDGAWICQNTWGEDFGEDGIFYVSYEDANLFRKGGIAYTGIQAGRTWDNCLEMDTLGWQARQGYGSEEAFFAGVFEADAAQKMTGLGFYTVGPDSRYEAYLVRDFAEPEDLSLPESDPDMIALGSGSLEYPGFHTVSLTASEEALSLTAGRRFAVMIHLATPGAEKPVAVEVKKDSFTSPVTLEGRESYISKDREKWDRTQDVYGTNVCLKVYTQDRS